MALSVRTRFEVFKRDEFTCRYCGRKSPEVILEVDHVIAKANGGTDDEMNLVTSCWECNSGKSDKPLSEVVTGDDPHDKAILLAERERQLGEYNAMLVRVYNRKDAAAWDLWRYWENNEESAEMPRREHSWLLNALEYCPTEIIRSYMDKAIARGYVGDLRWVKACVRNWRQDQEIGRDE
jgi:hypothetical protein